MSTTTTTQEAFDSALADIFEGRERQLGHGSRKLLREFYDRAVKDGQTGASGPSKVGQRVAQFADLRLGDVFQNDYLRGEDRCRRVIAIVSPSEVKTEYVSTKTGRVVNTSSFPKTTFEQFWNYKYIADPDCP